MKKGMSGKRLFTAEIMEMVAHIARDGACGAFDGEVSDVGGGELGHDAIEQYEYSGDNSPRCSLYL